MQTEIAVLRYGLGARPGDLKNAAADPRGWLLSQTKGAAARSGDTPLAASDQILMAVLAARKERDHMKRAAAAAAGEEAAKAAGNLVREAYLPHYRAQVLARAQSAALTTRPFAERLTHFWNNHFAISADKGDVAGLAGTLENEAIRPHVNGRFADMLIAVEQHPAMLLFLDNQRSVGPNSEAAYKAAFRGADRIPGINENLAREILELHTLGVHGGYTQADVTTFAKVISGWSIDEQSGRFMFRDKTHEPGAKTLLGRTYREDGVAQGEAVLEDLAQHPATAHFLATKLVRHFIADDPPPAAVTRVARAYRESRGELPHVYAALIAAPEAGAHLPKFKTPEDFVFSTLRSFELTPREPDEVTRSFELLGQRQYTPGSPAGWPDTASSWDGSDALMHRILWASRAAAHADSGIDPIELAAASLGSYARPDTLTAVRRASSGSQGLTLLLMSPEFQRR